VRGPEGRRRLLRLGASLAVGLAISVALAALLLRRVDLERVGPEIAAAALWPLVLALGSKLLGFLGLAWRTRALLRPYREVSLGIGLQGQLLGFAANNIVPFRMGELVKADYLARRGGESRSAVLAVAATERILDVFCLLALFLLVSPSVLPRVGLPRAVVLGVGAVAAFALGAWLIATRATLWVRVFRVVERKLGLAEGGRLSAAAGAFAGGLGAFRLPRALLSGLLGTALYWACAFLSVSLCLMAFEIEAPWFSPAVVLVFLAFGTALPASPGLVGTYHFFFVAALEVFAVEANKAASAALTAHALAVVPFTIVGMLLVPGSVGALSSSLRWLVGATPSGAGIGPGEERLAAHGGTSSDPRSART